MENIDETNLPCWGRHLRCTAKAIGEGVRRRARGTNCEVSQAKAGVARSRPKTSEEAASEAKGRRTDRRDKRRGDSGGSFTGATKTLGCEEARSKAAPLSELCTEYTAVIPLSCVEYCIITFMLREYSEMLAVGGRNGILSRE